MKLNREKRYEKARRLVGRSERYWQPRQESMKKKIRMLIDGLHFADSEYESLENESDMISWVGQESFHVWRHERAEVTNTQGTVAVRPLDEAGEDPVAQEQALKLVESEWEMPGKEYDELCEDMAGSASAAGIGAWMLEVQGEGRWGELVPRGLRYDQIMWDPAVKSPLSRRCRWLLIKVRMTREEALARCAGRKKWRASVVSKLKSDDGYDPSYFDTQKTSPTPRISESTTSDADWFEEDEITFYLLYERMAPETRDEESDDGYSEHEPGMRYMACPCGWRSVRQMSREDGKEYPQEMVCPECGQMSTRIDGAQKVDRLLEYPDGKLSVLAPYGGVDEFVYEGEWDVKCPNYPIVFLSRFRHPTRPYGPSLADLNWNQVALDQVMRVALERMMISASYWMLPADTLEDAWGQPWQFSNDNGFAMYYRGNAAPNVNLLEGTGVPNSWGQVYSQARAALIDKTGIADFSMGQEQSRNIPAQSAAIQVNQQEIPIRDYKRSYLRAKAWAKELVYHYLREIYPDERMARVTDESGVERVVRVRPSALPEFQFFMTEEPDFRAMDEGRVAAFNMIRELVKADPWALDLAEQVHRLPHSLVQKAKDDFAKAQAAAAPAVPGGPVAGGAGGMGAAMGPPAAPPGGPPPMPPSAMVEQLLSSMGPQQ